MVIIRHIFFPHPTCPLSTYILSRLIQHSSRTTTAATKQVYKCMVGFLSKNLSQVVEPKKKLDKNQQQPVHSKSAVYSVYHSVIYRSHITRLLFPNKPWNLKSITHREVGLAKLLVLSLDGESVMEWYS